MSEIEEQDIPHLKEQLLVDHAKFGLKGVGSLPMRETQQIKSSRFGVGFETLDRFMFKPDKIYPYMGLLGVKMARLQTGWSRCETEKGKYHFDWLDEIVDNLSSRGVESLFSITFGNKLYMPDVPHESAVGFVPLYYGEEVKQAWINYVKALARHFKGKVTYWEVWNEPNIPQFWHPTEPNATDYAKLVAITAKAVREEIPDAKIVGGVMSKFEPAFIRESLEAGMADWIDIFSFHPYQSVPEYNLQNKYDLLRRLLDEYSSGKKIDIWQGENGCPSQTLGHNDDWLGIYNMDQVVQAKWVARRMLIDLKIGFEKIFYFHIVDLMETPYRQSDGKVKKPVMMGLIHGKIYEPKYSFDVLRRVCSLFDDGSERKELYYHFLEPNPQKPQSSSLMSAPVGVSFVRGNIPLIAYWLTEDPQQKRSAHTVDLAVWHDPKFKLENPILLDLMTGTAYDISDRRESYILDFAPVGSKFTLPLSDYPLVLTDRAILNS